MAPLTPGSHVNGGAHHDNMLASYTQWRGPRPPCLTIKELVGAIKEDIDAAAEGLVSECTTSDLSLDASALIPLLRPSIGPYANGAENDLPEEFKSHWANANEDLSAGTPAANTSYPQAVVGDIIGIETTRVRAIVQRAASRGIVAAIESMDGFKYSFNNAWAAKDEDGQRFSYICQDSMQNKDRSSNVERAGRKPTYDCKGSISVKCSSTRARLNVYYRHSAIHPKVADRKQLPRNPEATQASVDHSQKANAGGLPGQLHAEESANAPQPSNTPSAPAADRKQTSNIGRPMKRKRDSYSLPASRVSAKPLSLFEILKKSESSSPAQVLVTPRTHAAKQPPPVTYDLPSWQQAATTPVPPQKPAQPTAWNHHTQPGHLYPQHGMPHLPYQPQQSYYPPLAAAPPMSQLQQSKIGVRQEDFFGVPQRLPSQAQGLFSTLKSAGTSVHAVASTPHNLQRPRPSCTQCRLAKRKCDEQRPICSACQRVGRSDCSYDESYGYPAPQKPPWQGPPLASTSFTPHQPHIERVDSPDPWFPKR